MASSNAFIPLAQPYLGKNAKQYVNECLDSNWVSSQGSFISKFEDDFAKFVGTKYAVAVSNGTVALHLALLCLDLKPQDEVIVPDLTFAATINTVLHANATPVIVDIDPLTWNISLEKISAAITPRTRAIVPVHLYGYPCHMDEILVLAKKHNIAVIEDAAEAHGAELGGKQVGSFGDIACFSFYGNKIITTGEGGMCVTNNQSFYEKMVVLRDHGMNRKNKYQYDMVGYNYRLTNPQAAMGVAQLEEIDAILEKRNSITLHYEKCLGKSPALEKRELGIRTVAPNVKPTSWIFTVLLNERDSAIAFLRDQNIETRPMFYPLHPMNIYKKYSAYPCKDSQSVSCRGISLPTYYNMPLSSVEKVCEALSQWSDSHGGRSL